MEKLTKQQSDKLLDCVDQIYLENRTFICVNLSSGYGAGFDSANRHWRERASKSILRRTEGYLEQKALDYELEQARKEHTRMDNAY